MHNDKYATAVVKAKRDPAVFLVTVCDIKDRERLGITENRGGTLKTDAIDTFNICHDA
jgi:hypothetical protein